MSNITGGTWVAVQKRRQAPWTNETIEVWLITTDARPNGPEIAYVFGSKADAELIAAAPEMLEALKQLRDAMVRYISGSETKLYEITQANAAIAKAEGK